MASCGGRLRNRAPREARDPALQALRPGCEELAVTDPAQMPVREARPREPKTATVERREASVPRHKRVHARLDALWDARRLASAWPAASCAGLTGVSHAPERFSALRPPLDSGERSNDAKPRAQRSVERSGTVRCRPGTVPDTACATVPDQLRALRATPRIHDHKGGL